MTESEPDPLEVLNGAIQAFANSLSDVPVLVDNALVLWEQVKFNDDGSTGRRVQYAGPTDNFTISGTLGLCAAGATFIRRDGLSSDDDD